MKNSSKWGNRLAYGLLLLLTLLAFSVRGQSLKLDIHVKDGKDAYLMTNMQVKEVTENGAEILRTFTMKKGKLVVPLELGKKYVLHFWAPGKEFRSVTVDCTDKSLDMNKTYTFSFDITLPDEVPQSLVKEMVAKIWVEARGVQYKML